MKPSAYYCLKEKMAGQLYTQLVARYGEASMSDAEFIALCDRIKRMSELSASFYYKDHAPQRTSPKNTF